MARSQIYDPKTLVREGRKKMKHCLMSFRKSSDTENTNNRDIYTDEFGFSAPVPADHGQRKIPEKDFPTGPEVGTRLPNFVLQSAKHGKIDFHKDRGSSKAAVVFFRSAVW